MPYYGQFQTPAFNPNEDDDLSLMGGKRKRPLPLGITTGAPPALPLVQPGGPVRPMPPQTLRVPGGEMAPPANMPRVSLERPMPDFEPPRPQPLGIQSADMSGARALSLAEQGPKYAAPELNRAGVDLPALPGDTGTKPYSPVEAARYDFLKSRLVRGDDGREKFKSSGSNIGGAILRGLERGGLPGAIAGGLRSKLDPRAGAEQEFNETQLPRIQAAQAAAQQEQRSAAEEQERQIRAKVEIAKAARDEQDFNLKWREWQLKEEESRAKRQAEMAKLTEFDPTKDIRDAQGNLKYKGVPKPVTERPDYPFSSAGNNIYNRATGEITFYGADGKEATRMKVPDSSRKLLGEIEAAKSSGDKAAFNALVSKLGGQFGDIFETGVGEGGWAYFKEKMNAPTTRRTSPTLAKPQGANPAAAPAQGSGLKRTVGSVVELLRKNKPQQ